MNKKKLLEINKKQIFNYHNLTKIVLRLNYLFNKLFKNVCVKLLLQVSEKFHLLYRLLILNISTQKILIKRLISKKLLKKSIKN